MHIKHVKTEPDINLHEMALATSGAAGADLANMVNEAALRAVRCNRKTVSQEDLMEAVEVIIAGKEKKDRIFVRKGKENRFVPRSRSRTCNGGTETYSACSQNHNRSENYGFTWLYNANA